MTANHARMLSSALVLAAGALLTSSGSLASDRAALGMLLMLVGGLSWAIEWIRSFWVPTSGTR